MDPPTTISSSMVMGRHYSDGAAYGWFKGAIDEGRISASPRTAVWIWAEWMNSASNSVFNEYSEAQRVTAPPAGTLFILR